MFSTRRFMVFKICVKFHENMSSSFKVMERTRKLLTDTYTHAQKKRQLYTIPLWHTSCARGIMIGGGVAAPPLPTPMYLFQIIAICF